MLDASRLWEDAERAPNVKPPPFLLVSCATIGPESSEGTGVPEYTVVIAVGGALVLLLFPGVLWRLLEARLS